MTGGDSSARGGRTRAGVRALLLAANPINRQILRTVMERPFEMAPGRLFRVSPGGEEVLFVGLIADRWLQCAPHGPLDSGSKAAERAVAALAAGWSATVMHALAREPLTFPELQGTVEDPGRRELKRHLAAMQRAGQVEAHPAGEAGPLYALTDWLRAGIAPLIAAARLERRHPMEGMAPIEPLDVEAGFRLGLPLIDLPEELTGSCRLGLNLEDDESPGLTGVTARITEGRLVSCKAGLEEKADAWAAASAEDWLDTVIEPKTKRVRTGGDSWLAQAILDRLHKTLFGAPVR